MSRHIHLPSLSLTFFAFFFCINASSQTLIRQAIGTSGGSNLFSNVLIQSTVGQPYSTSGTYDNSLSFRPGFIQPVMIIPSSRSSNFRLTVFPNPARNTINIKAESDLIYSRVSVITLYGQEIFSLNESRSNDIKIDCTEWATGTYIITVYDSFNKIHTAKIIKNN